MQSLDCNVSLCETLRKLCAPCGLNHFYREGRRVYANLRKGWACCKTLILSHQTVEFVPPDNSASTSSQKRISSTKPTSMRQSPFALLLLFFAAGCQEQPKSLEEEPAARSVSQYSIEQFYKSSEVFGGAFTTDDAKLLVTSNESGIFNAYEIDIASGQKTARTNSTKESVFASSYVPGTHDFIYSSDKGGNEISHLYLKRDSAIRDLTPAEKEKANFGGWSRDGKVLY